MMFVRRLIPAVALLSICFGALMTGCTSDPNIEFIEGQWVFVDPHLQEVVGQSFLEHSWVFGDGRFSYEACCLREVYMKGYYHVVESGEDYIVLDLYDIDANEIVYEIDQQIRITLDRTADTIIISHGGPFTRLYP